MSKKTKAAAKESNLRAKRARKQANRTQYEKWRLSGENTKRNKKRKTGAASTTKHLHLMSNCGNLGCKRCYPKLNRFYRKPPKKRLKEVA